MKNIFNKTSVKGCYKDVVDFFSCGLTPHQIADKFNITYSDVIFCLKNYGKFRTSIYVSLSEQQVNDILNLCDDGKKVYEIADQFKIDRHCVGRVLKRYGRKSKHSNKKFDHLRKIPFSKLHKEIIVGSLLGDGCVHKQRKKSNNLYKYYLSHSKKQEEYFLWKFNGLSPFFTKYYEIDAKLKTSDKIYQQLKSTSIGHPEFKRYYDMFYDKDGTKHVPKNIDLYLNPLVMSIWFMDDGSLNSKGRGLKGSNLRICSLNFTYEDHIVLKDAIKACFDINTKIGAYNRNGRPYYYISFNKRNSILLKNLIEPYVLPSMLYKLNLTKH